jgi:hypothetical protein
MDIDDVVARPLMLCQGKGCAVRLRPNRAHTRPCDRTVGDDELRRHGIDPSSPWPDELDYW